MFILKIYNLDIKNCVNLIFHNNDIIPRNPWCCRCVGNVELWVVAGITLVDTTLGIVICVLFVRRLLLILAHNLRDKKPKNRIRATLSSAKPPKTPQSVQSVSTVNFESAEHTNKQSQDQDVIIDVMVHDCDTWKVLQKFTLLTVFAIATTFASLALAVLLELGGLWVSIDMMINCWCVILMFHSHRGLYQIMCLRLQKCAISRTCLTICACNCCCCKIEITKRQNSARHIDMMIATNQTISTSIDGKLNVDATKNGEPNGVFSAKQSVDGNKLNVIGDGMQRVNSTSIELVATQQSDL